MKRTYVFKKPKEWSLEQWKRLIVLLEPLYAMTTGQSGPDDYEIWVEVNNEEILHRMDMLGIEHGQIYP